MATHSLHLPGFPLQAGVALRVREQPGGRWLENRASPEALREISAPVAICDMTVCPAGSLHVALE